MCVWIYIYWTRALKKLYVNIFPVDWYWKKNAWMMTQIMTAWFTKFDEKMKKKSKKSATSCWQRSCSYPHHKRKMSSWFFLSKHDVSLSTSGSVNNPTIQEALCIVSNCYKKLLLNWMLVSLSVIKKLLNLNSEHFRIVKEISEILKNNNYL